MTLDNRDLKTIYDTILRAQDAYGKKVSGLEDIFSEDARLIITPNNNCQNKCYHCVADSNEKGKSMPFDKFTDIPYYFFKNFKIADFGRRGNPLIYSSQGRDLADMIFFLYSNEIKKFTIAAAIREKDFPVNKKLVDFVSKNKTNIETMITYHHYFKNLDEEKLAIDMNSSIKNYSAFSQKIVISLLGDEITGKDKEVNDSFSRNRDLIFKDIKLDNEDRRENIFKAEYKTKFEISIPKIDKRVYPLGRFRNYLKEKGILHHYERKFESFLGDYVCPDLIKWPGIIIETDGSLNLCASFEAIACKGAIASNIFENNFEKVKQDIINYYNNENRWFIENLQGIIEGKISTCRLKRNP